uniref:Cytochrome P450 71A8-like n=2 Tax=Nicotiana sylvestris TaxID=4096 RepID=A0A1U7WBD8_NICSY|nr:PREDICTED: cytochrome P450 71A8-like [Nicotiana sylvestris]
MILPRTSAFADKEAHLRSRICKLKFASANSDYKVRVRICGQYSCNSDIAEAPKRAQKRASLRLRSLDCKSSLRTCVLSSVEASELPDHYDRRNDQDHAEAEPYLRSMISQDIFAGGTDTTYTVLEWAMTELLRHSNAMKKLQNEVREIGKGKKEIVCGDDLDKMHYLKAVIKETLRLHPPIRLLIPRQAREDAKVMGYEIAAGSMVITNGWAIGRDPTIWDNAEEFKPERFLNSSIDFKGHAFGLIPFGAGRRGCPGISFAMATNELVLANVVKNFNWELPKWQDLDMTECTGLTIHRKIPLLAVATPCNSKLNKE